MKNQLNLFSTNTPPADPVPEEGPGKSTVELWEGDCLVEMDRIESGSVDLVLADPPYGNMKGIEKSGHYSESDNINHDWDIVIGTGKLMQTANRILRKNGKMVLFAQDPYSTELKTKALPNVPYNYSMIWEKDNFANGLSCKKAPVSYFEDILVFSKNHDTEGLHPLRPYALELKEFTNYSRSVFTKTLGHGGHQHFMEGDRESSQFNLCTEKTYQELIETFHIDTMRGFVPFADLEAIDSTFKSTFKSTFNLWQGKKYKSNILKYAKDYTNLHPTQKPILLIEDLVKTYSDEGDRVVDFSMGSGTTGAACISTRRNFIGIELDPIHFQTAKNRIDKLLRF